MSIRCLLESVDMQRVTPDSIYPHIRLRWRHVGLMVKADHLTLLIKAEISICIFQCISAVCSLGNTLDDKAAPTVGTWHTDHGLGLESWVSQIIIQSYEDALYWFQITGIEYIARYLHRIDLLACREAIRIVSQRITLVVVYDSITEVYRISGVRLERVLQLHNNPLTGILDLRHFELWRRHDDLIGSVL